MQSSLIILKSCLESAYCIILRIILRFKVKSEHSAQKMKFPVKNFFSKCDQIRSSTLVTFIEKIFNGKLHILCSDTSRFSSKKSKCESGINAESWEKVNDIASLRKWLLQRCQQSWMIEIIVKYYIKNITLAILYGKLAWPLRSNKSLILKKEQFSLKGTNKIDF